MNDDVPYGLLGDQAELGLANPLAIPDGVVVDDDDGKTILSPLEVAVAVVVVVVDPSFVTAPVVELDRDMACGWPWP
jgi:hypothetical protein